MPQGEWKPIETAPLMKIILLFAVTDVGANGEALNWKMGTGCLDREGQWEWGGRKLQPYDAWPTHWMSLPRPPVEINKPQGPDQ